MVGRATACRVLLLAALSSPALQAGVTSRVSVDSSENEGSAPSYSVAVSLEGRFLVFESQAPNLVPDDRNNVADIFLRDVAASNTTRVSVGAGGQEATGASRRPTISPDGRFVAFDSFAPNLVSGDLNGVNDVFVVDRQTGGVFRVSVDSAGGEANANSCCPSLSADGRFVVFESLASNLVTGDRNELNDIFLHDRQTGGTLRVSVDSSGLEAALDSYSGVISADGRVVAYESYADNLAPGDGGGWVDIFLYDVATAQTTRITPGPGIQPDRQSYRPTISADGRFVSFETLASNFLTPDVGGFWDVLTFDRLTGAMIRASVNSAGSQAADHSGRSVISADGRWVAFDSPASNMVSGDTGHNDVFVHDNRTGRTVRVSVNSAGAAGNDDSDLAALSPDGRFVAFASHADNLAAGDLNDTVDVFLHDRACSPAGFAPADFDQDCDVDGADHGWLSSCATGPSVPGVTEACRDADLDHDGDVDQEDFGLFQRCFGGANVVADPACAK